jgi:hypothetical protein
MESQLTETQSAINQARLIMESFDPSGAMTIGFDEPTYTLTAEQMGIIAGALYLADCDLDYLISNHVI